MAELTACAAMPHVWGEHDCVRFVVRCVQALTGRDLALPVWLDEAQARAALEAAGGLVAAVGAYLRPIVRAEAGRGDVVRLALAGGEALGVIEADQACFVTAAGLRFIPLDRVTHFWSAD
ncbi:MAG: DUF6950 family protein [Asticcacaulis sp.]